MSHAEVSAPPMRLGESILRVSGMTKRYGSVVLDDVSVDFRSGEIHALLGANGAGKSTLCKIIAGLTPASAGEMFLGDSSYVPTDKADAEGWGIEIVQQELNVIPTLTVAENLYLRRLPRRGIGIDRKRLHQQARVALARVGLDGLDPATPAGGLGVGERQLIEIAAALDRNARVLILDEPTAALAAVEAARLIGHLRLLRDAGLAIIYISHRLEEVLAMADQISVLRDGKLVATRPIGSLVEQDLIRMMTGVQGAALGGEHRCHRQEMTLLRVRGLTRSPRVCDISFDLAAGERLGIAGLVGSGRTELLRAIFGADAADSGELSIGQEATPKLFTHPRQAVRNGVAMITEDRKSDGLLLSRPVRENVSLIELSRFVGRLGRIRTGAEGTAVRMRAAGLELRCRSIEQPVGELSGGNQQKVAIAKWLDHSADFCRSRSDMADASPRIFLFDEPTRGIDVAARQKIYELFESLAASGAGLLIVSSDLDELMQTCDAIGVISMGRWVTRFERDAWDRESIMKACFHHHRRDTAAG